MCILFWCSVWLIPYVYRGLITHCIKTTMCILFWCSVWLIPYVYRGLITHCIKTRYTSVENNPLPSVLEKLFNIQAWIHFTGTKERNGCLANSIVWWISSSLMWLFIFPPHQSTRTEIVRRNTILPMGLVPGSLSYVAQNGLEYHCHNRCWYPRPASIEHGSPYGFSFT